MDDTINLFYSFLQQVGDNSGAIALVTTIGTAFARVTWSLSSAGIQLVSWRVSVRTRTCRIQLGPYQDVQKLVKAMKCLVVRYGNDRYLTTVASPRDRLEGRLQNKVIKIDMHPKDGALVGKFKLRVHKRLGTQFICAIDAIDIEAAKTLADKIQLRSAEPGSNENTLLPRREGMRVFVLLHDPMNHTGLKVTPVDDIRTSANQPIYNNMYYPF